MFGDGKWRMIDSLGSSALIGGGEKERGGRNAGTVRIALSKNSEIRAGSRRGFAFPPACTPTRLSPPRSAFFGSFEVGNQLDCLSTPEKSPCTLPSVHSFSCSHTLSLSLPPSPSLYHTLTHGHATTLFFLYSLHAARSSAPILRAFAARRRLDSSSFPIFPLSSTFFRLPSLSRALPPLSFLSLLFLTLDIVLVTHLRETIPQNVAQSVLHCSRVPLSSEGLGKVCRAFAPNPSFRGFPRCNRG